MEAGKGVSFWRRPALWTALVALMLATVVGYGYRNAPLLADWYAGFAADNLPEAASSFAPTETETGAYFYCARQVAKRMRGQFSVETFPSQDESQTRELGTGKYQVESYVDEARADGQRVRYTFVCTVNYDRGRWVLEKLDLSERFATAPGVGPALATRE